MQKYNVDIPDTVLAELEEQAFYIAQDSVEAALRWYDLIEEKIQTLEMLPARCSIAEESRYFDFEVRQLIVGNYRILFRIDGKTVKILHLRGSRQERKEF
ncbi:MAG: type II toxin-antitoxin system RelE/ParE family toxin [Cyanobacteria bacterium P01_A01_bin.37]